VNGRNERRGWTIHRELTYALGSERTAGVRVLDQDGVDLWRIERGRNEIGRQAVVLVATVLHLDLFDRGPADRLQAAALDLPLRHHRMQCLAAIDGGDQIGDAD